MARNARTLAVFDIVGFGERNDADQKWLRGQALELLKSAAKRAGIPWRKCRLIDRGDGWAILIPAAVGKEVVADAFVREVVVGLRAHDRRCGNGPAAMRMRLALHFGEVARSGDGWVGTAINTVCRLVDAPELRDALRDAPEALLAVCVSGEWFHAVVEQNPDLFDPGAYTPIAVVVKELDTTAWVRV
jgi:hypothetical protein